MNERIVYVVWPVTICSLYTCILLRILAWNLTPSQPTLLDQTWRRLGIDTGGGGVDDAAIGWEGSLIIVILICSLIVIVTLLIMLILYMGWHQCLVYYFYLPSLIVLSIVTPAFLWSVLRALNTFAPDIYTIILLTWNFTALGLMAIFGLYAPTGLCLQQFYLIHNSAILTLLITLALPGWAPWLLLAFLVIWDLFAVLAPYGPLNLIIDMAERVGIVEMPGLVYSTELPDSNNQTKPSGEQAAVTAAAAKDQSRDVTAPIQAQDIDKPLKETTGVELDARAETRPQREDAKSDQVKRTNESAAAAAAAGTTTEAAKEIAEFGHTLDESNRESNQREESGIDQQGVSIGLGDFVFYSLLIGLTSKDRNQSDFYTVLATLVAVLFGLVLTLIILTLTKRALPALPISVALGLAVAALTNEFVPPFANCLATEAIFV